MGQLQDSDDLEYAKYMREVCYAMVKESIKTVKDCNDNQVDLKENIKDIHISVNQVLEDDIIDITKDMSRETIVKILTKVSMAHSVAVMADNPMLKMALVMQIKME